MSDFERYREQIEETLGRPIRDAELAHVGKLSNLLPSQIEIVKRLASRQIVLCALFLHTVTDERGGAVKHFMDEMVNG